MKLAIITWCSSQNFGTYLQAYAMQWYLQEMGHEATLLDDSIYTTKAIHSRKTKFISWCKRCIKKIIPSYKRSLQNDRISFSLYNNFRTRWLKIDNDIEPIKLLDKRYDCYICGSDQIWNANSLITKEKEFFFATFSQKPKIAYAPSGLVNYPLQARLELTNLVKDFSYLSAREPSAATMLHDLTGKEVPTVVDPTLLVPKEVWDQLALINELPTNSYILLYLLTPNNIYIQAAKQYAKRKSLSLKIIHSVYVNHKESTVPAGPTEFLFLVKNANMVMTDSFHGTIFAIKYQRSFITFQRFHNNSQNSRITNLLDMINLHDRLISETNINKIFSLKDLNFEVIDKRLSPHIESSKKYLENAIRSICNE